MRKRLVRGFAIGAALFGVGLALANIVDLVRYHRAIGRVQRLSPDQLRAIGDYCRNVEGHARFETADAPDVFRLLQPIRGGAFRSHADAILYELGEVMVWLHVHTSSENQRIRWTSNVSGPTRTTVLWERDPEAFKRLHPDGRLLTLVQWKLHDLHEWIVLRDEVLVFQRNTAFNRGDKLLASAPLAPGQREEILAAIRTLKTEAGGRHFRDDDVMDGIELRIAFSPDGKAGSDDVVLANAWADAFGPLSDLVNRAGPREYPLRFRDVVARDERERPRAVTVRTLKEHDRVFSPPPRMPWWCVWRAFAL